jgi:hypothetical protein
MRILTILLAITSVAFASTTVYLARELSAERARASATVPRTASLTPSPGTPEAPPPAASAADPATPPSRPAGVLDAATAVAAIGPGRHMSEAEMKKFQAEHSKAFLAQMDDPEQREELLVQRKMMMRHSFPRVDQVLGLSQEEYVRFLELHALQQLEMQEKSARCTLDPDCSMQEAFRNMQDVRGNEINNLLGAERTAKFQQYQNTMGEREAITQLRNRMPDNLRLNDSKAEQLISALAEEREAMHRDAAQQGKTMNGFGIGAGMIYAPDNSAGSFEQRYEAARQNSQRLRERAATYLNSEQLRVFNEMQDETLLSLRSMMRQKNSGGFSTVTIAQ